MKYLNCVNPVSGNGRREFMMTLIDLSPSMDEDDWKPTRKAGAIKSNIELIKLKAQHYPQDIVGVIGFGSYAEVLHDPVQLSNGIGSICNSLKHTPEPNGTNFTAALTIAEDCFNGINNNRKNSRTNKLLLRTLANLFYEPCLNNYANFDMNKRIILLTDGKHNALNDPVRAADRLKNSGVVIDCIGIGGTPQYVDEKLLKKIASRNKDGSIRYCFIGDKESLLKKYETLAHHLRAVQERKLQ